MPLPDERPRQSVANLIGRFENQTKRQAPTSAVTPHHTGEPPSHEFKEKREWPPKSVSDRITSFDGSPARPQPSIPASQSAPEPMVPQTVSEVKAISLDTSSGTTELESKHEQQPGAADPAQPTRSSLPTTPPRAQAATKTQTAKAPQVATTSKSTPRTISKSVSRQSPGTPTIQPLKPQHTGLSTTSTTSSKKTAAKPPVTTTSTKPSVRSVSAMAVSPASARPKTPSSGLFAPTAASLAKSRSAQALPTSTTPIKKPALTASVSERLSKPTAASLSKARAPVPAASPLPRTSVKSTAGIHSPAKAVTRPKTTAQGSSKKAPPSSTAADVVIAPVDTPAAVVEQETNDYHETYNNHTSEDQAQGSHPLEEATAPLEGSESSGYVDETLDKVDLVASSSTDNQASSSNGNGLQALPPEGHYSSDDTIVEHQIYEVKQLQPDHGDDIESIVNLLEAVPVLKVRPASISSIPDEVHEIPDEE